MQTESPFLTAEHPLYYTPIVLLIVLEKDAQTCHCDALHTTRTCKMHVQYMDMCGSKGYFSGRWNSTGTDYMYVRVTYMYMYIHVGTVYV